MLTNRKVKVGKTTTTTKKKHLTVILSFSEGVE